MEVKCYLCEITLTEEIPEEGWTIENQAHDFNASTVVRFPYDSNILSERNIKTTWDKATGGKLTLFMDENNICYISERICVGCFDSKMAMACRACGDYFVDKDLVHSKSFDTESGQDQWNLDLTMCCYCYDAGELPNGGKFGAGVS
jgi:hypothetical protein